MLSLRVPGYYPKILRKRGDDAVFSIYRKFGFLFLCAALIFTFRCFVLERIVVFGDSMSGSFEHGSVLLSRKYGLSCIDRYDVIVVDTGRYNVIKRVIGMPGETVSIRNNSVYINDVAVRGSHGSAPGSDNVWILHEDEYFILGDNRACSIDSRSYGAVGSDKIRGKVIFQLFPFEKFGFS